MACSDCDALVASALDELVEGPLARAGRVNATSAKTLTASRRVRRAGCFMPRDFGTIRPNSSLAES
jgi:hypothetical protein